MAAPTPSSSAPGAPEGADSEPRSISAQFASVADALLRYHCRFKERDGALGLTRSFLSPPGSLLAIDDPVIWTSKRTMVPLTD